MAEVMEAVMMTCFGLSWPISVYKSWKSGKTGGKSIIFLYLIIFGYLVGITGKVLFHPSWVIAVYCCNVLFVSTDIALFYRNRAREKRAAEALNPAPRPKSS